MPQPGGSAVSDLIYITLTLIFFAASLGLVKVCERLMEDRP